MGPIRDTIYRLELGTLTLPAGADAKTFITSGGNQASKPKHSPDLTVGTLAEQYLEAAVSIEANTKATKALHLKHFKSAVGAGTSLGSIGLPEVQAYARSRRKQKHHGRHIQAHTIRKELETVHQVWSWAVRQGLTPTAPTWQVGSVDLPKDRGREPFRNFDQITRMIARGHLAESDQDRLWECLYLNGEELAELLDYVGENSTAPFVYPMTAFVALTGCRRSEMVRSQIDDWDLETGVVHIRG